jgi:hypothetical protein
LGVSFTTDFSIHEISQLNICHALLLAEWHFLELEALAFFSFGGIFPTNTDDKQLDK